ncbi:hypothetical protein FQN49_001818 [Arthroderma sp. PD_2]|nr:hypothetical protein FQN49_001818 [Arthroderma sp. PD_2]
MISGSHPSLATFALQKWKDDRSLSLIEYALRDFSQGRDIGYEPSRQDENGEDGSARVTNKAGIFNQEPDTNPNLKKEDVKRPTLTIETGPGQSMKYGKVGARRILLI